MAQAQILMSVQYELLVPVPGRRGAFSNLGTFPGNSAREAVTDALPEWSISAETTSPAGTWWNVRNPQTDLSAQVLARRVRS